MNKTTVVRIITFSGIILGLLFLLIYICSKPTTTILSEPTCSPPCWQNIIPGKSTVEETRTILDNLPLVDTETIITRGSPRNIYDEIIYFEFRSKRVKGTVRFLDGKVSMILFDGELGLANSLTIRLTRLCSDASLRS